MGDPRRLTKKYSTPKHPWQKGRIEAEKVIETDYGTKNKKEIWKMNSILKHFQEGAKKASALNMGEQMKKEFTQLLGRAKNLGILPQDANTIDAILSLSLNDVMGRRLQTLVYKKGLARSPKQARQFIVHEHIIVGGRRVNVPSYIVPLSEEETLSFDPKSSLAQEDHPERLKPAAVSVEAHKEEKKGSEDREEKEKKENKESRGKEERKPREKKEQDKRDKSKGDTDKENSNKEESKGSEKSEA